MTRMEQEFRRTGLYWSVTGWGEPLGCSWTGDSYSQRMTGAPGTLPTEAAARRVGRAFKAWIAKRFPDKGSPGNQYFMAFPDGAMKVTKSWKAESEAVRLSGLNHFRDHAQANVAAAAMAWLCQGERDRFEKATQRERDTQAEPA